MYGSMICDEKEMVINSEPPIETMQNKVNSTMGYLKELIMALDDTSLVLFGKNAEKPQEKMADPNCLSTAMDVVQAQARIALGMFMEMRKRMV